MIYSKEDVKRIIQTIRNDLMAMSFCYKSDNLPPKVIEEAMMLLILLNVEATLEVKPTPDHRWYSL